MLFLKNKSIRKILDSAMFKVFISVFLVFFYSKAYAAWPWSDLSDKVMDTEICFISSDGFKKTFRNHNGYLVPEGFGYAPYVLTKISESIVELYRKGDGARLIISIRMKSDAYDLLLQSGHVYFKCYD